MTELAPSKTEYPSDDLLDWKLDYAADDYITTLVGLGLVKTVYNICLVTSLDQPTKALTWIILRKDARSKVADSRIKKIIRRQEKQFKSNVKNLGYDITACPTLVRPERERALKEQLNRNNIEYSILGVDDGWRDFCTFQAKYLGLI